MKRIYLAQDEDNKVLAILTDEPTKEAALFEADNAAKMIGRNLIPIHATRRDGETFYDVVEAEISRDARQTVATVAGLLIGATQNISGVTDATIKGAVEAAEKIAKAAGL